MNLSEPFIRRPVATIVIMAALIIFGLFAYRALPVSEMPRIDFPTIVVTAQLPGADPNTMASAVATPLEKQFSSIDGIDSMSSTSSEGVTRITLQFALSRNIDAAAQDVQAAISQAQRTLPSQMTTPPSLHKMNPADSPILFLSFTAQHLPLTTLDDYAETIVAERLSMVPGVAEVDIFGPQQYAVRIFLNPNALATHQLDINSVVTAIQNLNVTQPSGTLQSDAHYQMVTADGQLNNAAEFNNAVITSVNNANLRIKDIGVAIDSVANDKAASWVNNKQAIVLAVRRQPDANTVAVSQDIQNLLPEITRGLPGDAKIQVVYDRSQFIKKEITDVQFTLIFAALLVIAVIFLFLGSISSTLITVLALPTSIIATFGAMYVLGYSLDNLSLMGLILAVGFVIDDAVVVLENIMRHVEKGKDRFTAALQGSKEVSFTIASMTLSLVAVFIPVLFLGGLIGRIFHEFAVVVAIAILFSGFVSLTLTPMLCSRLLRTKHVSTSAQPTPSLRDTPPVEGNLRSELPSLEGGHVVTGWVKSRSKSIAHGFEQLFERSRQFYEWSLNWSLDRSRNILLATVAIFIITIGLFFIVPKGFIPSEDTGLINSTTEVPEGTTYPDFVARQQAVATLIEHNPNVASVISNVGQNVVGIASTNTGQFTISLKPRDQRKNTADEVIQQLRRQIRTIPGINVYLQNPPSIRIGSMVTSSNYQYVMQGTNWNDLVTSANQMQQKIATLKGVQDLNSDLELNNPEIKVHILRDRAAALGITPNQIETALYAAYGLGQISTIYTPINEYEVIAEIDPQYQHNIDALNSLYLKSSSGAMVPLPSVAQITQSVGPLSINHYEQLPSITLSFNLAPGYALSDVTSGINKLAKQILPSDVSGTFAGSAKTFEQTLTSLPILLLFTVLIIYIVLAILYEHFIHPLTILTALPFAAFGALLALPLFHQQLDIYGFIGLIMLVGLVKKNGIMMVDFAINARREGATPREAIMAACLTRYRPIMMTTVAAILSVLPIALGLGAGGESRRPLGIAVVGGLLFSQILTLYVTPVFYLAMEKVTEKFMLSRFFVARMER